MKLSVSLPDDDVAVIDEYAKTSGLKTRSAVIHQAVKALASRNLENDYAAAWAEWDASGDAALWESTVGDGITDEPDDVSW